MKKLFFLFLLLGQAALAQNVLETNPTGLKWRQINSPNFRVVFPSGFDFQAQRIASTLERIRSSESRSLGVEPRKISIILQNQSSISNGFVSMFPRRSEFYTMPPQNYNFIGTNDWLNLLASHEYRHIVQYQHATRGFNKLLFYLFGAPTLAGMAHAAAPDWFWEGDAVATETAFTPSGRGKMPNFNLVFRTNILEGRTFNYHKQYLRSYKHNIPNHYVLGFNMVSYLRRKTNDPDIWEKITSRSWSVPFIPFAFSNAIRKETGMSVTKLYREMAKDLEKEWKQQVDSLSLSSFETVNKRSTKAYTDYHYPQPQPDGSVIVLKEGIGDIQRFVRIRDGKEEVVFTPGFMNDAGALTTGAGIITWNEFGYDPRWQVKNFSLIKGYDSNKDERVVVSDKKSRYGSAAISPDGKRIVTVRSDEEYKHTVVVLEYPSGEIEAEFPNPENYFFSMPRWNASGDKITVIKNTQQGNTISILDPDTKTAEDVFPAGHENVGHPFLVENLLFFNSPITGIDNIFVHDVRSGVRHQVTESRYGAYNAVVSPDGKHVYYNEQTRNGLDVVRMPFDRFLFRDVRTVRSTVNLYDHLIEQEGQPDLFENIPPGNYPVTKFSKFGHSINPFSWGFFADNDLSRIDVGITSQDILSTTSISAGYTYDLAEETGFWRAGVSYQGLYPIIDLNFTTGERAVDEEFTTTIIEDGEITQVITDTYEITWDEQNISAGLRIPLVLTRSKYSSGLTGGYTFGLTKVTEFTNGFDDSRQFPAVIEDDTVTNYYSLIEYVNNGTLVYNSVNLTGYHMLKQSRRDITSRWGQIFSVEYSSAGNDFQGSLFGATAYLYFPGLFKHHSFWGYVAYQETGIPTGITSDTDYYLFRNTIPVPRGINDYVARHRQMYSMSVNYALPLWYPDIAIGPLLNIQRVRLNLFADMAEGQSTIFRDENNNYMSVGGEVKFDINILRFLPQLDIGIRYSVGIEPSVRSFEFVLGTFSF